MIYISKLQEETLLKADELINKKLSFDDILQEFLELGYDLRISWSGKGRMPRNKVELCKDKEYSFVDIHRIRNKVVWETIRLY